jgi:putative tricarboxylic transport membrane protein
LEKRASRHPERFGAGAIEGVAGPEAAYNAAAGGAFIPLLTLGIPGNAVITILLGALMIHGLQPGPLLVKQASGGSSPAESALIPMWARLLRVPYALMFLSVHSVHSPVLSHRRRLQRR